MRANKILLAGLMAGLGSVFAGSSIAGTKPVLPVISSHVRRGGREPSKNPNALPLHIKRELAARGTHYFAAGRLRCKKKMLNNIPTGYDFGGTKRGTKAIGVNGIRGKSGGGR